jgi:hypothetical protein
VVLVLAVAEENEYIHRVHTRHGKMRFLLSLELPEGFFGGDFTCSVDDRARGFGAFFLANFLGEVVPVFFGKCVRRRMGASYGGN